MKRWNRKHLCLGASMLVVGVAFLGLSSPAAAQVVTWGGIVSGMPSCVSRDFFLSEEVVCVMKGTDHDLYSIKINPRTGATLGFKTIGYTRSLVGNPSCTASGPPFIACAVRGQLNELYGIIFDPETLASTGLQRLDQSGDYRPLAGDPSCMSSGLVSAPTVSCGVRGADNRLHIARFEGNAQGLSPLTDRGYPGEVIVGDPSCASGICVARSTDSSLAAFWDVNCSPLCLPDFRVSRLAGPTPFALGNPSCASTRVRIFFPGFPGSRPATQRSTLVTCGVRGTDSALYVIRFGVNERGIFASDGGDKAFGSDVVAYRSLGGIITNDPSCASTRSQVVTCGVRGTDGHPYLIDVDTETGSSSPYQQQPTLIPGDATCVTFSASERNVVCAVLDLKNGLVTVASVRPPL